MNAAAALCLIASAIEVVIGALALAFAAAPGWKHFRTFSLVAFSAAVYGAGNSLFAIGSVDSAVIPWTGRVNLLMGLTHSAAWIAYVRVQYGERLLRRDRIAIALLLGLGLLALVPGALVVEGYDVQHVAWAGVTYRVPRTTALGGLAMLVIVSALLGPVLKYVQKTRRRTPGARTHLIGFSIFFASAFNEILVALGLVEGLYLVDIGFLAAVLSVSAEMTYRVTGDARRLQELSAQLSREVEERTRELTKTRDNLIHAERLAALGRLSASIGHEINNPLSYVLGNLEYAAAELERTHGDPLVVEALKDARSGAERIRKIVDELRAFSRGSDGDRRELVEPSDVMEAAIKLVWGELRHRARLVREFGPTPKVFADPTRLTQVFVNLLLNAVQAVPDTRARDSGAVITARCTTGTDGEACVEIVDNGVGIPEPDRRRLFEPFFSTKPQDKGNGLGLFVSLGIVSALGGRIEVDSRVGHGTSVRVSLPRAQDVQLSSERVTSIPPLTKSCRLLVVDDDALVARTLARLLHRHDVETMTSGREALARLMRDGEEFDVILCDLMMPDMTGMDLYEEVERTLPGLTDRFFFISGGGITDRSRQFLETHADRVLPKPIDGRQLSSVIARRLRESEQAARPQGADAFDSQESA